MTFHRIKRRPRLVREKKPHCSLIYHEISLFMLTADLPWDFTLFCALFLYINHSVGKSLQHYANIYSGLWYPSVYSKYTRVKWESVVLKCSSFIRFHSDFFCFFFVYLYQTAPFNTADTRLMYITQLQYSTGWWGTKTNPMLFYVPQWKIQLIINFMLWFGMLFF